VVLWPFISQCFFVGVRAEAYQGITIKGFIVVVVRGVVMVTTQGQTGQTGQMGQETTTTTTTREVIIVRPKADVVWSKIRHKPRSGMVGVKIQSTQRHVEPCTVPF
jgi:hypothetical protein